MSLILERLLDSIIETPTGLAPGAKHFENSIWEDTYFTWPSVRKGKWGEKVAKIFYEEEGFSTKLLAPRAKKKSGGGYDLDVARHGVGHRVEVKLSYVRSDGGIYMNQLTDYPKDGDKGFDEAAFVCVDVDRVVMYTIDTEDFFEIVHHCPYTDYGHKGRSEEMWKWEGPENLLEDWGFKRRAEIGGVTLRSLLKRVNKLKSSSV